MYAKETGGDGSCMFFLKGNRERERYYLLPGQGGPAARRKQKRFLKWAVVACLVFCALMALVMYLFNQARPF
jgi:type VI protein secretion system component VasF